MASLDFGPLPIEWGMQVDKDKMVAHVWVDFNQDLVIREIDAFNRVLRSFEWEA